MGWIARRVRGRRGCCRPCCWPCADGCRARAVAGLAVLVGLGRASAPSPTSRPCVLAAVGVALLVGLLAGLSGALCGALLQTQADPAYLGRVTAVSGSVTPRLRAAVHARCPPRPSAPGAPARSSWSARRDLRAGGVVGLGSGALRRAELPGRAHRPAATAEAEQGAGRSRLLRSPAASPPAACRSRPCRPPAPPSAALLPAVREQQQLAPARRSPSPPGAPRWATAVWPSGRRSTRPTGALRPISRAARSRRDHRASWKTGSSSRGVQSGWARRTSSVWT